MALVLTLRPKLISLAMFSLSAGEYWGIAGWTLNRREVTDPVESRPFHVLATPRGTRPRSASLLIDS